MSVPKLEVRSAAWSSARNRSRKDYVDICDSGRGTEQDIAVHRPWTCHLELVWLRDSSTRKLCEQNTVVA